MDMTRSQNFGNGKAPTSRRTPHQPRGAFGVRQLAGALVFFVACNAFAQDWTMWGADPGRNMVSLAKNIAELFVPGKPKAGSEDIDLTTTKNVKWVVKLGSQTYGNTTVSAGKVLIGTNNESPRDKKYTGDYGIVYCFEEATGKFLWQLAVPKLGAGRVNDWEFLGICSSPLIEGDRVYLVTSRCEVLCLDLNGMANGNDGPFKDEAQYVAGPGKPPIAQGPQDADIIWRFDMREECGVFPHNASSASILVLGDKLYALTSNGQDWTHTFVPSPQAPTLICLDKKTGQLIGEDESGIGTRIMHCNWSSASHGTVAGKGQVYLGAGDGFVYAYDPEPVKPAGEEYAKLKEIWKYDLNPPEYKTGKDGKPIKYPAAAGPSEVIATPVFHKNRIYVATGQDPEHGEGIGILTCIDATKTGDITKTGALWTYKNIARAISTVSIADDLLYVADYSGRVFCLDAETGREYWMHETKAHIWGSTFLVDGKVFIGTEDGSLYVFQHSKEKKLLQRIECSSPIFSTPIVANGVLYVASQTHLYAVKETK